MFTTPSVYVTEVSYTCDQYIMMSVSVLSFTEILILSRLTTTKVIIIIRIFEFMCTVRNLFYPNSNNNNSSEVP